MRPNAVGRMMCWWAVVGLGLIAACDDTRFAVVETQVDTFVQDGEEVVDAFSQDGTMQVDTFEQSGFHQVDSFTQKASANVDILWVVDNSASMENEQLNLAGSFSKFMTFLDENGSRIDYHIGVISTDMEVDAAGACVNAGHCGQLLGNPLVIDPSTPDLLGVFEANVNVGIDGGGNEMGLLAAHAALTEPLVNGHNAGFLRPDASLAVIFVSDEDDNSYGDLGYYVRFFSRLKDAGNENNIIVAAIVGDEPNGCDNNLEQARAGLIYHELVRELGGTTASICEDFDGTLGQLGLTVAALQRKYALSREPDPGTVTVRVDEGTGFAEMPACVPDCTNPTTRNWRLEPAEQAIYFVDYVPPPQSVIEVEYANTETVFALGGRGDQSTIRVTVDEDGDGPLAAEEKTVNVEWWYDSATNSVVFSGDYVPPLGSTIEVSYSDLTHSFSLSRPVENVSTMQVEVDLDDGQGWRLIFKDDVTGWMFHAASNSVLFQGSYVPPLHSQLQVSYSNLLWLFPLSLAPKITSLVVQLDADGDGPGAAEMVPAHDEALGIPGYLYYDTGEAAPYRNSISFEKLPWPSLGSIINVRYNVGGGA